MLFRSIQIGFNEVNNLILDNAGNIYVSGVEGSSGSEQFFLKKFNAEGVNEWTLPVQHSINIDGHYGINYFSDLEVNDQDEILLLTTIRYGAYYNRELKITKFNSNGDLISETSLDSNFGVSGVIRDIDISKDGSVIIGGETRGTIPGGEEYSGHSSDPFIRKYDSSGDIAWTRNLSTGYYRESINSVFISSDGSIYFQGVFGDSLAALPIDEKFMDDDLGKLSSNGILQWRGDATYDKYSSHQSITYESHFYETSNGDLYLTGNALGKIGRAHV